MCGLVGVFGELNVTMESVFTDLLQVDVLRGPHSTGVAAIHAGDDLTLAKNVGLPHRVLSSPDWERIVRRQNRVLIGHNRWATRGKISPENAHPFEHGKIVLTHNGTLAGMWRLPHLGGFDTDSENIAYCIDKSGIDQTWENLDGAASLVFWNKEERSLNIISNGKRPIFWTFTKKPRCLVWASESWMIRGILQRHGVEFDNSKVWYPNEHDLWTFSMNKKGIIHEKSRALKPFDLQEWLASNGTKMGARSNVNHYDFRSAYGWDGWERVEIESELEEVFGAKEGESKPLPFVAPEKTTDDGMRQATTELSEDEFKKRYTNCVFCDQQMEAEYERAVIIDGWTAACGDCADTAIKHDMEHVLH